MGRSSGIFEANRNPSEPLKAGEEVAWGWPGAEKGCSRGARGAISSGGRGTTTLLDNNEPLPGFPSPCKAIKQRRDN